MIFRSLFATILFGFILSLAGCGSSDTSSNSDTDALKYKPIEYKLATLNKGSYISDNDITIVRFKTIIGLMAKKFPEETENGISDGFVMVKKLLSEGGVSENLLDIAEALNQITDTKIDGITLNYVGAAYVTLRKNGNSSQKTINSLRLMIKGNKKAR